jgi:nucleotide-binding universal stress UspA family protein
MLRFSPVPLLLLAADRRSLRALPAIRRIMVTTDFSEGSPEAIGYALSIARESRAEVTLLHVVREVPSEIGPDLTPLVIANAQKRLDQLVPSGLRSRCNIRTQIQTGLPYRVILETIEKQRPHLLVMNTHGKGFFERLVVGSTAERVVRGGAHWCPILMVPPTRKGRRQPTRTR